MYASETHHHHLRMRIKWNDCRVYQLAVGTFGKWYSFEKQQSAHPKWFANGSVAWLSRLQNSKIIWTILCNNQVKISFVRLYCVCVLLLNSFVFCVIWINSLPCIYRKLLYGRKQPNVSLFLTKAGIRQPVVCICVCGLFENAKLLYLLIFRFHFPHISETFPRFRIPSRDMHNVCQQILNFYSSQSQEK